VTPARVALLGVVLLLAVLGVGVADYSHTQTQLGKAHSQWIYGSSFYECVAGEGNCSEPSPGVIQSRWRSDRAWYGFGTLAVVLLTLAAVWIMREKRR
jgi:hypothetical protein